MQRKKREARDAAIWQRYLVGPRDPVVLAKEFRVSERLVKEVLGENYFHKTQGPPTREDYVRAWLMDQELAEIGDPAQRLQAARAMLMFG